MSKEDLIPVCRRPPEEAHEIWSKGGRTKSPLKKLAAKIRELKKKGLADEAAKHLYEIMSNPDISLLDIYVYLNKIKGIAQTAGEQTNLADKFLKWHETMHGSKKVETAIQISSQTNIGITANDLRRLYEECKEEDNGNQNDKDIRA